MRTVLAVHPAQRDDIADLVTRRPLPGPDVEQVDPFLFLNHHGPQVYPPDNHGLPFGPHPHRGFETVTFILSGSLAHHDSGGHESVIEAGGVQWMTAGSGLVHAELSPDAFKRDGGPLEILQLWLNLPPPLKMTAPAYTGLQKADIPALSIAAGNGTLNLIAGEFGGETGPIKPLTEVFMATVELKAGAKTALQVGRERNVFLYVVAGRIDVDGVTVDKWHLVELSNDDDTFVVGAIDDALLLYGHAEPIGAPVVARGPFVMNTDEEIQQAIADYRSGKFGDPSALGKVGA
ncbi:pirin family protein [Pleomorphomonas koreensis]|uniref:pirin family protein n=1 Tax=Pleomorphomonas koreensis TaxID=257440 RepID=UPI00041D55C9|nr:pirin family protein [Pleomorphomonas koreensis]